MQKKKNILQNIASTVGTVEFWMFSETKSVQTALWSLFGFKPEHKAITLMQDI